VAEEFPAQCRGGRVSSPASLRENYPRGRRLPRPKFSASQGAGASDWRPWPRGQHRVVGASIGLGKAPKLFETRRCESIFVSGPKSLSSRYEARPWRCSYVFSYYLAELPVFVRLRGCADNGMACGGGRCQNSLYSACFSKFCSWRCWALWTAPTGRVRPCPGQGRQQ
jgi:hypothetical protein